MEKIKQNSNRKTLTALAGILFFSYFIKKSPYYLNSNTEDRIFFDHYLKIGEINLIFLIGDLLFLGMNFFIDNIFVEYGTKILSFLILVLSFFASLFAIGGYQINFTKNEKIIPTQILKFFIPFYNFKLWTLQESYEKPSWRLKESILRWNILSFLRIFCGKTLGCIFIGIFLIRIFFLCLKIDIIPTQLKQDINKTFLKFPHEIRAYVFSRIEELKNKTPNTEIIKQKKLLYQSPIFSTGATKKEKLSLRILGLLPIILFIINHLSLKITGIMIFESSIFIFFYLIFLSLFYYQYHYKKTLLNIPLIYELLNLHDNSNETNINQ